MELTIGHLLTRNASTRRSHVALVEGEASVTWGGLCDNVMRVASGLETCGVIRGSRVATITGNNTTAVELLFSLAIGGSVGVPINHSLTLPEIDLLLQDSDPHAIIV